MTVLHILLQVIGGLAIFIYGMKVMSSGLYSVAGQKMRSVLQFFSANRYIAIAAGAVVTAAIQSSGASTVMVIGFINAGLLNLVQAVGIIFGTNIGTTLTAQIIAFDVGWLIMPIIILGVILEFFKKQEVKFWGKTIIGLGLLFFGMQLMSDELKALRDYEWFTSIFSHFNCAPVNGVMPLIPVLGAIFIGIIVTVMMQSSSACSGIILALGASGVIDLYTAIALILGSNIGSTVTAQLAALTANRIAKQAALAHTLFNVIGVILTIGTFWITIHGEPVFFVFIKWISLDGGLPRQIANAHTVFNVATTLLLMPFIPLFAKLCEKLIPVREPRVKFQRLEPHLLDTPVLALAQTVSMLRHMLRKVGKMTDKSIAMAQGVTDDEEEQLEKMQHREERVDEMQKEITEYLSRLMRRKLTRAQANVIPILIHCTNDTERIGDHTEVIVKTVKKIRESGSSLSETALNEILELQDMLHNQTEAVITLLEKKDTQTQDYALELGRKINNMCQQFEAEHLRRLNEGKCQPATAVGYIELLAEISKVSHRLRNVAERATIIMATA